MGGKRQDHTGDCVIDRSAWSKWWLRILLSASLLRIDPESVKERIVKFLRARLSESGQKGFVFGLSGGVDSSTIAALCASAVQHDSVLGLIMPHRESDPQDKEHAMLVIDKLKIPYKVIDITGAVEAIKANLPSLPSSHATAQNLEKKRLSTIGNIKARVRMINLYMAANETNSIVVGSGDKSEFLIGYFTKYGDGGTDILPIADLYKTQVRVLATHLGVPEVIVTKPSSPGLWKDQTAEGEIGMKYEQLDMILYGLEHFMEPRQIADALKISAETVLDVEKTIRKVEHKRRGGIVFKIGYRTPTLDWRIPL
jgi:NAD+ synthase